MAAVEKRCAIYTRKSSEEGLEQSFNSLDAQYEACASYIASQRHEGWRLLPERYDDGGYSGGNMERPALALLLEAIDAGKVDLIVVYKIDRLTRSLMDFARLVDRFDRHAVSFVSVTQAFNTTTSMGRLTLNVLLSFAQFEREVTGERIRDKIAASKRKGMWMGGTVPMGYFSKDRKLAVDPLGAELVVHLFERYLALGSVAALKEELDAKGIVSHVRTSKAGHIQGGKPYSRGALYLLLKNRTYRGDIPHKGDWHPGEHEAIVPEALWDKVQAQLELQRNERKLGTRTKEASLLAGMVVDGEGQRLTPSHTAKGGKRYRYYLRRRSNSPSGPAKDAWTDRMCVPAHDLERLVTGEWKKLLRCADLDLTLEVGEPDLSQSIRAAARNLAKGWSERTLPQQRKGLLAVGIQVRVFADHVEMALIPGRLAALLLEQPVSLPRKQLTEPRACVRTIDARVVRLYGEKRILEPDEPLQAEARRPMQEALLKAIAQGRKWHEDLVSGEASSFRIIARRAKVSETHVVRILRCAWLAPDLIEQLIEGRASPEFSLVSVKKHFTASWEIQRERWK